MSEANASGASDPIPMSEGSGIPAGIRAVGPTPAATGSAPSRNSKIRTFDQKLFTGKHEDSWDRTPNANKTGAIHVRSFHCKFNEDSLAHLDQQINEWLDAHPQYEVKLVTTSHGEWKGKLGVEPCLVVQVWV